MATCCSRKSFNLFGVFLLFFIVIIPTSYAHIAVYDDYWTQRQLEAEDFTNMAYNPFPEKITQHLNFNVARTLAGLNSTRRELKREGKGRKGGKCKATNPIDKCWRCDKGWANNRKRLADCALGFGRDTIGGKNGKIYVVTKHTDDDVMHPKPGTLRHAVTRNHPLWIIFDKSMVIRLQQELIMQGDKTIDCRGSNVHVAYGSGITIQFVKNVIIHGCHIHDIVPTKGGLIRDAEDHYGIRTHTDGDGVSIFGSSNIWLDHLVMFNCFDGLIDAIMGSTAVTISNCFFTRQNAVMLFGASDSHIKDKKMQITLCFNRFGRGLVQRMPRSRHGFVHVVNNDYYHWLMYAIGGSAAPTVISQGNRFVASANIFTKEVTKREYSPPEIWKNWDWRSDGDLMLNGAYFNQSGDPAASKKHAGRFKIKPSSSKKTFKLSKDAGSLYCKRGCPC